MSRERGPLPTRVQDLPPLPAAYHDRLDEGLEALDVQLARRQRDAIEAHVRLLLAWNQAINLTAIRDPEAIARLHVLDSLAAVPLLREARVRAFLDLGSGGGFPGIPLAVALEGEALLVESIGKKARFLTAAIEALGLAPVAVAGLRAEALAADARHREQWPAVTARAVAPLAELVALAFPLLAVGGRLVAWKRGELDAEIDAARPVAAALGGGDIDVVPVTVQALAGHRLVVVRKRGTAPQRTACRRSARRRRRP